MICVQIFENKQHVNIFLPSIANLKRTPSDRQMYAQGYMYPRLGTPELDDGELGEQKCTQMIGILPGPMKKQRIKRIDELNDDELDEFY